MSDIIGRLTDNTDGLFGVLPFHTMQNQISGELGVTERKTQLGFEDNDHKYRKSNEVTLDVALLGRTQRLKLAMFKKFRDEGLQDTLILLKNYQILENMVITKVEETETFDDGDVIYISVTFKEIRHGVPAGNALEDTTSSGTTKAQQIFNKVQTHANQELLKLKHLFIK